MTPSYTRRDHGFTLLEVLVALLILSFGMLGLVGMQAFALQSNRDAKLYAEGSSLARELTEMMRGNNLIAIQTNASANPYLTTSLESSDTPASCLSAGSSCSTTTQVAEAHMQEWRARVRRALPSPRVEICFDSQPYSDDGRPQWGCIPGAAGVDEVVVLKLGWSLRGIPNSQDSRETLPLIVIPVTGGNPFPTDPA